MQPSELYRLRKIVCDFGMALEKLEDADIKEKEEWKDLNGCNIERYCRLHHPGYRKDSGRSIPSEPCLDLHNDMAFLFQQNKGSGDMHFYSGNSQNVDKGGHIGWSGGWRIEMWEALKKFFSPISPKHHQMICKDAENHLKDLEDTQIRLDRAIEKGAKVMIKLSEENGWHRK